MIDAVRQDTYTRLVMRHLTLRAARAVAADDPDAGARVNDVLRAGRPDGTAYERLAWSFGRALGARLRGDASGGGNLYSRDGHDMLAAFSVLVTCTPLVRFGHTAANLLLREALAGERSVRIMDIGIGTGAQWNEFFPVLAGRPGGPPSLTVTGIDLPGPGTDPLQRLRDTGRALAERARSERVPFQYEPVAAQVESLDVLSKASSGEALVVNAALALHHVAAGDAVVDAERSRDALLRRIRELEPRVLTLIEPEADHNALPFSARVAESFTHYGLVFELLEATLRRHPAERHTLEELFFGAEILNVVAAEGPLRVERHERFDGWNERMARAGFAPLPALKLDRVPWSGRVLDLAVKVGREATWLTWKGTRLLCVSAWTCAPHASSLAA